MKFTADFETTTDENDCRVWACGLCNLENYNFSYGNNIEFFIKFCELNDGATIYFHNLKFDGEFIISYLFEHGFKWVKGKKELDEKSFTTLISDKGQFYSLEICFKNSKVKILDSLKIIPFSVEEIAKTFDLPIMKEDIDYSAFRSKNHKLTEKEISYLKNDVEIVARALNVLFSQNLKKMTQGSNALQDFKNVIGKKNFERWFPIPAYDGDIRQSYKGGFTYCDPRYKGVDVGEGIVLDVNSLYPSVMYYKPLPYGEGKFFEGKYETDKQYNLYIQCIKCQFELKENMIPTIQLKNNLAFCPTEYLHSSNGEDVVLYLTSIDLELFLEHYNVYNIEYISGWKFKSTIGIFKDYIDKWTGIKIKATIEKNYGMRTLAKLMLNALYGKFALNPSVQSKIPYLNEDGIVKYRLGEKETRKPIYIPIGTFITAWARYITISSAQKCYKYFRYADTDSLHMNIVLPEELKKGDITKLTTEDFKKYNVPLLNELEIDPVKLGAWKVESIFTRARFVRQKTYIEEINGKCEITCAGMPKKCYENVNWNNFRSGNSFKGKLQMKHVKGGIVLKDIDFTIK